MSRRARGRGRVPVGQALRRRRDVVNDVEVASVEAGPEQPRTSDGRTTLDVVMVHGLGVSNRYLLPSLRAFAREHRVFAPDLPGVGRSSRPERDLSMVELADGLSAWMDEVGVGRAVLVGHSLGCQVVAQIAARHPDRVAAVVLTSPAPDPGRGSVARQAWGLLVDGGRERLGMVLIAATDYPRVGIGGMLGALRASARRQAQPDVQRIDQPTLVVRGGRDPLVSAAWAQHLEDVFPDARVVTLPDAPHGVPYSATTAFVEVVHAFVDEITAARR
ncbi:alpha/beta hydrolase [Microlunatus spumicola]|uniref:Alpha/beta hydrolase n=1 Tax=Microlunatus spumicola TaxID=81499 RepID=A0ABP6WSV6_9ACTN